MVSHCIGLEGRAVSASFFPLFFLSLIFRSVVSTRHFIQRARRGWGEGRGRETQNLLHKDKHLSRMGGGGGGGWRERETDYTRMNI